MSTAEALCIKHTFITDQIGLGHLISKHEMFCFEKKVIYHTALDILIWVHINLVPRAFI
jgi:hypothetical protein